MTVESQADLLSFLNDFGVTATIGGTSVIGIFDDSFLMIDEDGLSVTASAPDFLCRTTDVSSVAENQAVIITGTTWYVGSREDDGTGMTRLVLHK